MPEHTKAIRLKEVSEAGDVSADIATLNVKDHDGDVTLPGAFGKQDVRIVGGHNWDDILLGKGTITDEDGKKARFDGKFNLDDPKAKALHSKVMFDMQVGDPMIEWSYGYDVHEGGEKSGDFEDGQANFYQPLADGSPGLKVFEVSPVFLGAGIGTGTTAVKSRKFIDHVESVHKDLADAVERAEQIANLRAEDGKQISDEAQRLLGELAAALPGFAAKLEGVLAAPQDDSDMWFALDMAQTEWESLRQSGVID